MRVITNKQTNKQTNKRGQDHIETFSVRAGRKELEYYAQFTMTVISKPIKNRVCVMLHTYINN